MYMMKSRRRTRRLRGGSRGKKSKSTISRRTPKKATTKQLLDTHYSEYSAVLNENDKPIKLSIIRRSGVNGIMDIYDVIVFNGNVSESATLKTDDGESGTLIFDNKNKLEVKEIKKI